MLRATNMDHSLVPFLKRANRTSKIIATGAPSVRGPQSMPVIGSTDLTTFLFVVGL